ncbi:hypothetical protein [Rhizobium sp. BK176]|uniref:hypothetical protein n=1 Tax=Rhizobium sp. BK176 TaxID=2587071 RepID=UPI00216A065A|nr:hypothetical protein [Rhizobium sp. BK176]MCS4088443.1 hypothetical protein [Rhizobium sp. BK176]
MKLDIRFPILARCIPTVKKGERFFWGSHVHTAEIAEISSRETEIGLERITFKSDGRRRKYPELRLHHGRLYRPLGGQEGLFSRSFNVRQYNDDIDHVISIPPHENLSGRPVADPLRRHFQWIIDLHGADTHYGSKLWPDYKRNWQEARNRNDILLSETPLEHVYPEDFEAARKMIEVQADSLLFIDGQPWMATTMPCITVFTHGDRHSAHGVAMKLGFLSQGLPGNGWMRFPLSAYEEALDFANQMLNAWCGLPGDVIEVAELDGIDLSAVGFDHNAEAAHTMALTLGSNIVRRAIQQDFHPNHRESGPLFEGEQLAKYERIHDAVLANNDILDQRSDLTDLLPELHDEWRRLKRPRYEGLNVPTPEMTDRLIEKGFEMAENTVISIPTVRIPTP